MNSRETWKIILVVGVLVGVYSTVTEGWNGRVKLQDVDVLTLRQGHMTNGRRSAPVPQMTCVGGSAGCSAFVPKVIQCYNRGSDGYDVQWECKADMDNEYRFGDIAVNCEGYDYPEDPYILKGSCGLEYTIDRVGGNSGNAYYQSSHSNHHGNYAGHGRHRSRMFPCSMSTLIMWGIIAFIVYYIYSTCSTSQHTTDSTQNASQQSTYPSPPPPGFRPEYAQDNTAYTGSSSGSTSDSSSGLGGFWSGFGTGGLAGYLFGSSRGYGRSGYHHHDPYYSSPGYNRGYGNSWFGGGNSWFGGNGGNTGWFGGNGGNTGWFGSNGGNTGWFSNHGGSSGSMFGSTHRRSSPSSSSSGSRTASGFGGTKRR